MAIVRDIGVFFLHIFFYILFLPIVLQIDPIFVYIVFIQIELYIFFILFVRPYLSADNKENLKVWYIILNLQSEI